MVVPDDGLRYAKQRGESPCGRSVSLSLHRTTRFGLALACCVPAILSGAVTFLYGVNVCIYDEFRVADMLAQWASDGLHFDDLWTQHVVHRIVVPLTALVLVAKLTDFNSIAAMYCAWAAQLLTVAVVFLVFRRQFRDRGPYMLWFVPVSALLLSLAQFENFLQGFQLTYVCPLSFAVLSFFFLGLAPRHAHGALLVFGLAVCCATLATFSSAMGLFTWPAALPLLLAMRRFRKMTFVTWLVSGTLGWMLYFKGFIFWDDRPFFYFIGQSTEGASFLLTLLGNALFFDASWAPWGGAIITTLGAFALGAGVRHRELAPLAFWIALAVFSILNALAIAHSRLPLGLPQATASKYATYMLPLLASIYVILLHSAPAVKTNVHRAAVGLTTIMILSGVCWSGVRGMNQASTWRASNCERAVMLYTYDSQPDETLQRYLHPYPALMKPTAAFLKSNQLNVFAGSSEPNCGGPLFFGWRGVCRP